MRATLFVIALAGCASAGRDPSNGGVDATVKLDGNGGMVKMDAPMSTDAPSGPMTRTLSETTSDMVKYQNTIACPGTTTGTTAANNYYRVFDLAAMGISGAFAVSKVSFQIEHCQPTSTTATNCANVAVRVGTYAGTPGATLTNADMTILTSNATVPVPKVIENTTTMTTPGGTVDAPITATIPAGAKLLVEVDAPNTGSYGFYMGSNDGGESAFGYIMAPDCSVTAATNISSLGSTPGPRHLLLTVTGTY